MIIMIYYINNNNVFIYPDKTDQLTPTREQLVLTGDQYTICVKV